MTPTFGAALITYRLGPIAYLASNVQPLQPHQRPQAIRDFVRATRSGVGNMPPMPGIFPDYPALIVRDGAEGRELDRSPMSNGRVAAG